MTGRLAAVWTDAAFRQRLKADPKSGLRRLGILVPDDVAVKVLGSRGTPSDGMDTLLQFVLERGTRFSSFFMPSPHHPSAQQGAYGRTVGNSPDDAVFEQRLQADAAAALREIGAAPLEMSAAACVR